MVARSFVAFDNESLVVDSSSSSAIVGNPIINNSNTPDGTVFTYSQGTAETITLDDTGGRSNRFEDNQASGHTITDGAGLVDNGTPVEAESIIELRALDDNGNPTGPTITLTVFSQNGDTSDVWGFATDTPLEDGVSYVKTAGNNSGTSKYSDFATCFGPGTRIATASGHMLVDDITPGDQIWTQGNGLQPVRWVGRTTVRGVGAFAPVVISPGALGNEDTLIVSQEHRMYFDHAIAAYLFGAPDVLIAAKHLCALPGISIQPHDSIAFTHFMFDSHQIVSANGILSESFFLSETSLSGLDGDARRELLALFPHAADAGREFGATAALALKRHEASLWCQFATAA